MAKKVKFTLSSNVASNAEIVQLLGDFNNWELKNAQTLKKDKSGNFTANLELEPGVYKYRYLINNFHWVNDESGSYEFDPNIGEYNCVISIEAKPIKAPKAAKATTDKPKKEDKPKAPKPKDIKPKVEEPTPVTPVEEPVKKVKAARKATKKTETNL